MSERLSAEREAEARAMVACGGWFAVYPARRAAELLAELDAMRAERDDAIATAVRFGGVGGDHHKAWVIDQMVRVLAGPGYERVVAEAKTGHDGPHSYEWDTGIAP